MAIPAGKSSSSQARRTNSSVRSLDSCDSMSKLMRTLCLAAACRMGRILNKRSRIEPSVSIGSRVAERELILTETLARGTDSMWSLSKRSLAFQVEEMPASPSIMSRYRCK